MKTVGSIYIAPVKSLGLNQPSSAQVGSGGILGDRRFHLINQQGQLLTQREVGRLVQVKAEYTAEPERLRLSFPDGTTLEGPVEPGELVTTPIWGRYVTGRVVSGDWSSLLSDFCGEPVRLAYPDEPGQSFDEYPISIISRASVEELNRLPETTVDLDSRRFRPNFLIEGCAPLEEETWLGGVLQIGEELRLRVIARDPRCAITAHDPATGETDINTLRLIRDYRASSRVAYLGVYGMIECPGMVSVGDEVTPVAVPK